MPRCDSQHKKWRHNQQRRAKRNPHRPNPFPALRFCQILLVQSFIPAIGALPPSKSAIVKPATILLLHNKLLRLNARRPHSESSRSQTKPPATAATKRLRQSLRPCPPVPWDSSAPNAPGARDHRWRHECPYRPKPGATAFTRIPSVATSRPKPIVSASTAALDAA